MNEAEFEHKFEHLLKQLNPNPGGCPSIKEILAGSDEQTLQDHLAECEICRELVRRAGEDSHLLDDLSWKKVEKSLDSRPSPWKEETKGAWFPQSPYLRALAAGLLLVTVGLGIWINRPVAQQTVSVTRGAAIQMLQPVGQVDGVSHFQWSMLPLADVFRVTVAGLNVPVEMETSGSRLPLPENLRDRLVPGQKYRWRVEALDEEGKTILESEWAEFRIGSGF